MWIIPKNMELASALDTVASNLMVDICKPLWIIKP